MSREEKKRFLASYPPAWFDPYVCLNIKLPQMSLAMIDLPCLVLLLLCCWFVEGRIVYFPVSRHYYTRLKFMISISNA